jgi:exo-beta-1,3-glucanase (GH17 family)/cellulose synthase/poly-beta-1,6-N-acetylglucosamine synthase-like glycosyltransferase
MFDIRHARPRVNRLCWLASLILFMAVHAYVRWPVPPNQPVADIYGRLDSLSYTPPTMTDRDVSDATSRERIDRDLAAIDGLTGHIRTYSVSGPLGQIPELAEKHGLTVSLGLWIKEAAPETTRREIAAGIEIARSQANVTDIYVGNESLLRKDATVEQIRSIMREIHQATGKPVTTGEMWFTWLEHPELAEDADFIGAHIFPFWEGLPADQAVEAAFAHYDQLRQAFPGKRIVIAEFGWPSGRSNARHAVPSLTNEAVLLRNFIGEARKRHVPYNIMEAFDQPLKTNEGPVGQYWGILDAGSRPKFGWSAAPPQPPLWPVTLVLGLSIGLLSSAAILRLRRTTILQIVCLNLLCQIVGYGLASALVAPLNYYLTPAYFLMLLATMPLVLMLIFTAADRMRELFHLLVGPRPQRLMDLPGGAPPVEGDGAAAACPFVSIHVPVCNEPLWIVEQTLNGLARLTYARFEILVLVNNCSSPKLAREIGALCDRLGQRFRALDLGILSGFKAGALNAGLRHTAAGAAIIAVVDADYLVRPDWLQRTAPAFAAADLALIQAPQDHRDVGRRWSRVAMNAEYGCFFDVGMIQRNEHNAIITHGTMLLIRKTALEQCGGWDEHCICEDTELGLRILLAGWKASYTSVRFGAGLLPDDWCAYRMQRQRWAYGALWILRKHWRAIASPRTRLTLSQRYHFFAGWMHWIADGFGPALAILNLGWFVSMKIFKYGAAPPATISLCILAVSAATFAHGFTLQATRPSGSLFKAVAGMAAAMSLQMPIARALSMILRGYDYPFIVTRKGGRVRSARRRMLIEFSGDAALGTALLGASIILFVRNIFLFADTLWFGTVMAVQALPYLIATAIAVSSFDAMDGETVEDEESARRAAGNPLPSPVALRWSEAKKITAPPAARESSAAHSQR